MLAISVCVSAYVHVCTYVCVYLLLRRTVDLHVCVSVCTYMYILCTCVLLIRLLSSFALLFGRLFSSLRIDFSLQDTQHNASQGTVKLR